MKKNLTLFLLLTAASGPALADNDIDSLSNLVQTEFKLLSEDLGSAISYRGVIPAEPLGITGFDLGLEVTATSIENTAAWDLASSGDAPSTLYLPKLHVHKGLPLNFDVGAFYTSVPSTNIRLWGAELRYAIMEGGVALPAVAVRGTYSSLDGIDELDMDTKGLELSISKGFAMLTPYAGIGTVRVTSTPHVVGLSEESFSHSKVFAGVNLNLGLLNMDLEGDKTGDNTSYTLKLGWRF